MLPQTFLSNRPGNYKYTQKLPKFIFIFILSLWNRSILTWEAFILSILISEVNNTWNLFFQAIVTSFRKNNI
jgi:hypothetical protein